MIIFLSPLARCTLLYIRLGTARHSTVQHGIYSLVRLHRRRVEDLTKLDNFRTGVNALLLDKVWKAKCGRRSPSSMPSVVLND